MRRIIPAQFVEENELLTKRWLDSEETFDEIVAQYGSEEFKKYRESRIKRERKLLEQGIIED